MPGQFPEPAEAVCQPDGQWGYYWLSLVELHNCQFTSIGEIFNCYVCHAPTRSNYWHFELHFHTADGDVYALDPKQRKKVAPKIRAWLQDYVYTHPPLSVPAIAVWPVELYTISSGFETAH